MTQGIYKLTNDINDKVYIGQSRDIEQRFKEHMYGLKGNKHHAYKLQRFYNLNKNAKSFNIHYEILEIVENHIYMNAREFHYIEKYDSHINGYNSRGEKGSPVQTKKKEQQNKKADKINTNQLIFNKFIEKYGNNIALTRNNYSPTFLYRVNKAIEYFIKNYRLDTHTMQLEQYKDIVTLRVYGIYTKYYKVYTYSAKHNCIMLDQERQRMIYKSKYIEDIIPPDSKLSDNNKCSRKLIWFMKRFHRLDADIIQHNTIKYVKNKYSIPFKVISKYVGYEGKKFRPHVIDGNDEVYKIAKKLDIDIPNGCMQIVIKD